jgi:uncharacterized membrane protein
MNLVTIDTLLNAVTLVAALGCGLMAGLFFAFSTSVMRALARLPPAEGIAAMQSINIAILNPVFLAPFLGTAVACALVAVASFFRWHEAGAAYPLVGGALYLVGTFLVTVVFNVPLNNSLASVAPADPAAADLWDHYLTRWTAWNHVRAATALAAAAALTLSTGYFGNASAASLLAPFLSKI